MREDITQQCSQQYTDNTLQVVGECLGTPCQHQCGEIESSPDNEPFYGFSLGVT
jgi:hypothetical protein